VPVIIEKTKSKLDEYHTLYETIKAYITCERGFDESVIKWLLQNKNVTLKVALDDSIEHAGETTIQNISGKNFTIVVKLNPKDKTTKPPKQVTTPDLLQTLNHEIQLHVRPYVRGIKDGLTPDKLQFKYEPGHYLNYDTQHKQLRNSTCKELLEMQTLLIKAFPALSKQLIAAHEKDIKNHKFMKKMHFGVENQGESSESDNDNDIGFDDLPLASDVDTSSDDDEKPKKSAAKESKKGLHQEKKRTGISHSSFPEMPARPIKKVVTAADPEICDAVAKGNLQALKGRLTEIRDKSILNHPAHYPAGWTALHFACATGNFDCASELIRNGADINIKNKSGQTALALIKNTPVTAAIISILTREYQSHQMGPRALVPVEPAEPARTYPVPAVFISHPSAPHHAHSSKRSKTKQHKAKQHHVKTGKPIHQPDKNHHRPKR
jgi:hypothetical protein